MPKTNITDLNPESYNMFIEDMTDEAMLFLQKMVYVSNKYSLFPAPVIQLASDTLNIYATMLSEGISPEEIIQKGEKE